ncbi:hypothetical protein LUW75_09695 [Streptomyces sp. MRC013]|uniref:hypothetical protein n=1 Tax=Streptomyces sp. MRC013 TaxID=2898276 RepID=UPI002026CE9D|nr:hypothetical protein [Streptomyces sp. MRC013]URM90218.1 hypothetical protein LUW75_09695 [Streptomyces sp. MRC013]
MSMPRVVANDLAPDWGGASGPGGRVRTEAAEAVMNDASPEPEPAEPSPESREPSRDSLGSKLRSHIGWWVGVASALIGIFAFFLNQFESDAPAFSEWQDQVNAICQQEIPSIGPEMEEATESFVKMDEKPNPAQSERDAVSDKLEATGSSFLHLAGSWRALERPDDHQEGINDLIRAVSDLGYSYGAVAYAVSRNEDTEQLITEQLGHHRLVALEVQALKLEQCQELVGKPEDW